MTLEGLFGLSGKRALVTGGTTGIGLAVAQALLGAGAQVVVASDVIPTEIDRCLTAIPVTLGTKGAAFELVEQAAAALGGPIDILVSNAGREGPVGPMATAKSDEVQALFEVNLMAAYWLAAACVPGMVHLGGGSMIFTGSIAGLRGNARIGPYGLTKAALSQLARNLAVEHGPANIRANSIAPGLIQTQFSSKLVEDSAFMTRRLAATPLRRMGLVEEVASAALWLAGPGGGFTTGQTIVIDGGTLIGDGS